MIKVGSKVRINEAPNNGRYGIVCMTVLLGKGRDYSYVISVDGFSIGSFWSEHFIVVSEEEYAANEVVSS
jgi:hypothetical protein